MNRFAFLSLAVAALFAQSRPDARDLLSRADASVFAARTVRLAATQSQGFVGSQLPGNRFKIEFVRGGKGRAEFLAGNTTITSMVFDGTDLWTYHQLGNQYTKAPASAWTFQGEIASIDYGRRSANILTASYQKDETIDFRGSLVDCYLVLAKYPRAPYPLMGRDTMRRVWISKDSELIVRDYWEGGDGMGTANRTVTTDYTDIETDIPLPDDLFAFQPPPASKMSQPQVLGGIIGSIPSPPGTLQKQVDPEYSDQARAAGLQGSVILRIEVDPDGIVQKPLIIYPLGMGLDEKALAAVSQWRYGSTRNVNVLTRRVVEIPFRLKPAGPWLLASSVFSTQLSRGGVATTTPVLRQYVAPDPAVCSTHEYVEVNFQVGSDGVPADIRISADAARSVRDAVLKAVQTWRFRAASRNGSDSTGSGRVLLECRPAETLPVLGPIYSSMVVEPPSLLFRLEPDYSEEARKANLQGQITLSLVVGADGSVSGVQIRKSLGMGLDEQAIGAVMQWRFKPGTKDGKPVRVATQVTVSFGLP